MSQLKPSLIRALHDAKVPGDIDLGLGQADMRPDMAPFDAAMAWIRANGCPYTPNAGVLALREAVSAHRVWSPGPQGVVITHGSQEALYLVVKSLLRPGIDEVLIPTPAYGAYGKICDLEGIQHQAVDLGGAHGFTPKAQTVLDAITARTRLILLASPVNPTGRVWTDAEFQALAAGLAERPGPPVYVLVDEVYRALTYHADAGDLSRYWPHTLVVGGLSKSHALTGLRIGWLLGPAEVASAAVKVHQQVTTAASTFSQRVALEILNQPHSFTACRSHWSTRQAWVAQRLAGTPLRHTPLDGAFYSFLAIPPSVGGDSLQVAQRVLAETRVVTIPGAAFGAAGEGWLRISYAGEDAAIQEGITRVAEALHG